MTEPHSTSHALRHSLAGAAMIEPDRQRNSAPLLRRSVRLEASHGEVTAAHIAATALGVCELSVNGRPVAHDLLTPGWSSYEWRLRYATWDVKALLAPENVITISIGHGWYSGHLGFAGSKALYGAERAALAALVIEYADGHIQTIVTDDAWQSGPSEIVSDDLYNGQKIDARLRDDEWQSPNARLAGWTGVREIDFDHSRLTPYVGPPVVPHEAVRPQKIWTSPSGALLLDFGQNLVGWIRIRVRGARGHILTVRHAEVLENGELGTRPLRLAKATDEYVLSGGDDLFEPTLTFHGFRYAQIHGWALSEADLAASVEAVVIGSDLRRTGTFECSDPMLNQLHSNVVWSMRGNFVDLPTDCPQRDERLGWTGDLAAFTDTAAYLYDVDSFLRDWLLDLAEEQTHAGGAVPVVVPDVLKFENLGALGQNVPGAGEDGRPSVMALWNDATNWVPWSLWEAYGDLSVLTQQYDSIAAYTRRIGQSVSPNSLIEGGMQLGDWLDPTAPSDAPFEAKSDPFVVATACVYRSAVIAAKTAALLEHSADAEEFAALAERIRGAFNTRFVEGDRIRSDAPAAYSLAICFDLLDAELESRAGDRLAQLAVEADYRITTGFAGTPFILHALTRTGHVDVAYRMLLQQELPSWLYPVTMGATTTWERWDSMQPDGSINAGEMTSFNHYAFGAVADWMHKTVGGLAPLSPGYSHILIAPQPGGSLSWSEVELQTPHGTASVKWRVTETTIVVDALVPGTVTAVVRIPGLPEHTVGGGTHQFVGSLPRPSAKPATAAPKPPTAMSPRVSV